MNILENPLFKHKKILEKECELNETLFQIRIDKSINEIFHKSSEVILKPKIEIETDHTMPEWIKCKHRMRRYEEGLGVISYCLHPFNPIQSQYGLYLVVCNKRECNLDKYYDALK